MSLCSFFSLSKSNVAIVQTVDKSIWKCKNKMTNNSFINIDEICGRLEGGFGPYYIELILILETRKCLHNLSNFIPLFKN